MTHEDLADPELLGILAGIAGADRVTIAPSTAAGGIELRFVAGDGDVRAWVRRSELEEMTAAERQVYLADVADAMKPALAADRDGKARARAEALS